jgi:lipopolysaccharide/colanic/teichoic acid biosynthesis glycosyltransferase
VGGAFGDCRHARVASEHALTIPCESRGIPGASLSLARRGTSLQDRLRPGEVTETRVRDRKFETSKRALDVTLGILALIVFAPVLIIAAVLVRLTSQGPALFRQTRMGQDDRPFTMFKLRTMRSDSDDHIHRAFNVLELAGNAEPGTSDGVYKLEHDPRVTKVGRVLRRFSIDELPQLFNVLRGDMSLVGPRPSLPWEVVLFTPEQRLRNRVRPGMTGLWQVSGRNRLSMLEMLALDISYVERRSLLFDLSILLRTPRAILFDQSVR